MLQDTEKTTNDEKALVIAQELIKNKAICKALDKQSDELKEKLMLIMADATTLINQDGKKIAQIMCKNVKRLDLELLKEAVPDIALYYKQTTHKELKTF